MTHIEQVRAAVADGLQARGVGNADFIADIREGRRDGTPFMVGAIILAERVAAPADRCGAL